MKTRRSLQQEKEITNCMQSVLFPERKNRSKSNIVPETPGNYNAASNYTTTTFTAASVLETPDDIASVKSNPKATVTKEIIPQNHVKTTETEQCNSNRMNEELEDSLVLNVTPDLNLHKRKGIISILESEYSFANTLMTKATKNSSLLSIAGKKINEPTRRTRRQSLAETILPFDLNNDKLVAKKLSNLNNSLSRRKSLAIHSSKEKREGESSTVKNAKRQSCLHHSGSKSTSKGSSSLIEDMSLEESLVDNRETTTSAQSKNNRKNNDKSSTSSNVTTVSFDNSNLDLTEANCDSDILVQDQEASSSESVNRIPRLNFSSTDNEGEDSLHISKNNINNFLKSVHQDDYLLFKNFSTLSCKEYEKKIQNKENSLYIENHSPISNYNKRVLEGELSPMNKPLFQSQDSLSPTQPASVLVLQGVIAFVDVRSGAENRSEVFKDVLLSLGAVTIEKFTTEVTHVIFRDGSKSTYQRSIQRGVHLVSPLWVDACKVKLVRVSESLFPISSEYTNKNPSLSSGKVTLPRKLKSMQPRDLEEDVLMAEARLKRKRRLQSNTSSNSEEVFTPPPKAVTSQDANSPLFGIGHLLTPTRECRESVSSMSSEMSSSEKEFRTPLATRMYNRFFSPNPNLIQSPLERIHIPCTLLAKDGNEKEKTEMAAPVAAESLMIKNNKKAPSINLRRFSVRLSKNKTNCRLSLSEEDDMSSESKVGNSKKNLEKGSTSRTGEVMNSGEGQTENKAANGDNDSTNGECTKGGAEETNGAPETSKRNCDGMDDNLLIPPKRYKTDSTEQQIRSKPRKSILGSMSKSSRCSTRRSTRRSVTYKAPDNYNSVSDENVPDRGYSTNSQSDKVSCSSSSKSRANGLSSSLPLSCCQESTTVTRRRRLHTVDIVGPSEELIVPSTPPLPNRNQKPGPYDELRVQCCVSQREEMKCLNKKFNGDLKVLPLPRRTKHSGKGSSSPECNGDSSARLSFSGGSLSTLNENHAVTPKRRFSLVPRERNSLEEFQSPRNVKKRRNLNKKTSPRTSLPSICVTSVHSCNIGSVYAIIKSLGGFHMTPNVESNTTHVVCGSDRRTINVLLGISHGCWILDVSWLYESVEILKWAPEEPFELFNFCPGAKISRMNRINKSESFKPALFGNVGRIYVPESCSPPAYIIQDLLHNCGANLCSTIRSADLIIGVEKLDAPVNQVSVKWIFDSIQYWEVKEFESYFL